MRYAQCCQQSDVGVHLHRGYYLRFQAADTFPVLIHLYLEIGEPAVHAVEELPGGHLVLPVIRHTALGGKDALVVAHPDARADGCLDAVLVEGDDKRRGQLVRFPFLDADGRVDAAQDMRLDGHRPVLLFHLG